MKQHFHVVKGGIMKVDKYIRGTGATRNSYGNRYRGVKFWYTRIHYSISSRKLALIREMFMRQVYFVWICLQFEYVFRWCCLYVWCVYLWQCLYKVTRIKWPKHSSILSQCPLSAVTHCILFSIVFVSSIMTMTKLFL